MAQLEVGVHEDPTQHSDSKIIEYFSTTTLQATDDSVPWCSAFLCYCFEKVGIPSTKSARSRSWLAWGVSIGKPIVGCVVILQRGSDPNAGHVGLYLYETQTHLCLLGGNQGDAVSTKEFPKGLVVGYRLPSDEYWSPVNDNTETDTRYT